MTEVLYAVNTLSVLAGEIGFVANAAESAGYERTTAAERCDDLKKQQRKLKILCLRLRGWESVLRR